jgi:hypothetical protein
MEINWGLLQGESIPNALNTGIALGQRNALLRRDLDLEQRALDQRQLEAKQTQGRQQRQELDQQTQRLIVTGARIIQQVNPTDEAGWQRVRAAAQQLGLPLDQVPPNFDPNYVQQVLTAAQAIAEHTGEQFTLGENDIRFDASGREIARGSPGRPRYYPVPQGGRLELDPSYQGPVSGGAPPAGPAPGTVEDGYRFRGGDPGDPANWEPVQGGAGSGAPAPFDGSPAADGGSVIRTLFPNARITDTRRPANSRLGRANPRSWHVQSGAAVDIAPIAGMTFREYVSRIRAAGYPIIEARDEVNNPSSHATGPHWHVVIGQRGS